MALDPDHQFLRSEDLQLLVDALWAADYEVLGPQVRDGAIVFDLLHEVASLPRGLRDVQSPGAYRLQESDPARYFGWANGPQALKPLVFAPEEVLWDAECDDEGRLCFREPARPSRKRAILGVRACDLAALFIQDKHFLQAEYVDPAYRARRQNLFLVAVNCTHPASTCFCASTGDGPAARYGYDLAMTELETGFVMDAHSDAGADLLATLPVRAATGDERSAAGQAVAEAANQQRALPGRNLRDSLFNNLDHPRWEEVAGRCLACGNCTSVCPTCFCNQESDQPALDGAASSHVRQWDSCFNPDHAHVHGMHLREQTREQYRQWVTHKLGSWHDQYGRSGCVGCGRCIAWCPAEIDLVEEVSAITGDAAHD